MTNQTIAEKLSERFNDDGQNWVDSSGIDIEDAAMALARESSTEIIPGGRLIEFPDSSLILIGGSWWDIVTIAADGSFRNSNGDSLDGDK